MTSSPARPAHPRLLLGSVLDGQYHLEAPLARGGMSTLFRGTQLSLGRSVAVKVLDPVGLPKTAADGLARRFRLEAGVLARITHPNVVALIDYGEIAGPTPRLYLVLELLDGDTLGWRLRTMQRLPPRDVLALARGIGEALREVHRHGVVHRDLKPANVMLIGPGCAHVKVLDFGISKLLSDEVPMTTSGMRVGSPRFMAPEQVMGGPVDGRTDVYALGTIIFLALTGQHPFDGDDRPEIVRALLQAPLPSVRVSGALAEELLHVARWCLQRAPNDRPKDAETVLAALPSLDLPRRPSLLTTCLVSGAVAIAVAAATAAGVRLADTRIPDKATTTLRR